MYENIKIYNYDNMKIWKYTNMEIYKYTCRKKKFQKCKRLCKESKYLYIKSYKLTSHRNAKPNKKKEYIKSRNIQKCI